jgi:Type II CAAX prenyl endopeptidase Rce1-like
MQQSSFSTKTSYAGLILSVALLVLLAAEFSSFALGAYFVYDKPTSNVIAVTSHNSSGAALIVNATGLQNSTKRSVWIDPDISVNDNNTAYLNPNSGLLVGNVTTNSSGGISMSFQIDPGDLSRIQSDGQSVHTVWVLGEKSSSGSSFELTNDSEQNYTASTQGSGLIFFVTLITLELPVNFSLGGLFIVLWTIYLILFAVALNGPIRNILSAIMSSTKRGTEALFDNSMLATLIVFPVVVWITVALSLLEQAGGISTGSLPPADPLLQFVELSIAPFREELGFRVIPIGIVAMVILFSSGRVRDGLMALWHPSRYLKKNDTPEQYNRHLKSIYAAIIVSAVLFGLAHVLLGAGWGPGKILSAAVAGIGLAGLYYLYGFPAAVLLHWSIDYFLSIFDLNASFQSAGEWITLYTLALSVAGSLVLILIAVRRFRSGQFGVSRGTWSRR